MNLPNAITLGRIAATPVVLALVVLNPEGSLLAAGLFVALGASDCLDGHLARSRNEVTRFGALVDPLADKLLVLPALAALALVDRVAAWAAAVIIAREIGVSALRAYAVRRGTVISANVFGKAKMWVQSILLVALIAVADTGAAWVQALVYITVIVTVLSGVEYARGYRRSCRVPVRAAAGDVPARPAIGAADPR